METFIQSEGTPLRAAGLVAAGGVEFFIFLLLMAASAVFNWMKKRAEEKEVERLASEENMPRRTAPPPAPSRHAPQAPQRQRPAKALDWEEELKRMLGEVESPPPRQAPPPVVAPPPPPVIRREPPPVPPPVSPPPSRTLPPAFQPKMSKGHCEHCDTHIEFPSEMAGEIIICPRCHQRTALAPFQPSRVDELAHQQEIAKLRESQSAYARAKALDKQVESKLADAVQKPVEMTQVHRSKETSAEVRQVLSLFKNPQNARQAMAAVFILGKPKALESGGW